MIIRKTLTQNFPEVGGAKFAYQMPEDHYAVKSKDRVTILGPDGDKLHEAPGHALNVNDQGQALWLQQGYIMRWDREKGLDIVGKGYQGMTAGPDGKVVGIKDVEDEGKTQQAWVLLSPSGRELDREVTEKYKLSPSYASHDRTKFLVTGLKEDRVRGDREYLSEMEIVGDDLQLSRTQSRYVQGHMDGDLRLFLQDGRIVKKGIAEKVQLDGKSHSDPKETLDEFGNYAHPGGRLFSFTKDVEPAVTLQEQMAQIRLGYLGRDPIRYSGPGTVPVWSLPDSSSPEAPEIRFPAKPKKKKLPIAKLAGAVGALGGGALAIAGLAPLGVGLVVVSGGVAAARALTNRESTKQSDIASESLADPKLVQTLLKDLQLEDATMKQHGEASSVSEAGRHLIHFTDTGMVLTAKESDGSWDLDLFGPTGDEKKVSEMENFDFDPTNGILKVNDAEYNLNNGTVSSDWMNASKGTIEEVQSNQRTFNYEGNGKFGYDGKLPLPPEVFSSSVEVRHPESAGTVSERVTELPGNGPGIQSLEKLETVQHERLGSNQAYTKGQDPIEGEAVTQTRYRALLPNGRTLEGGEDGLVVDGKKVDATMHLTEDGFELRSQVTKPGTKLVAETSATSTVVSAALMLFSGGAFGIRPTTTFRKVKADLVVQEVKQEFKFNGDIEVSRTAKVEGNVELEPMDRFLIRTDGTVENLPIHGETRSEQAKVRGKRRIKTGVSDYRATMKKQDIELPVAVS